MYPAARPVLTLAFACGFLLAGCDMPANGLKAKQDPVPLQKAEYQAQSPVADDKIARLEQQVAELQKEVAAARPKIAKIDFIEQKFKDLSLGLDKIDATYNMKPAPVMPVPVMPAPVVAAAPEKPVAPAPLPTPKPPETKPPETRQAEAKKEPPKTDAVKPPAHSGEKSVNDLRIGEKAEFSRLVLDLGQTVKINYDIDNDEKILVIDIPGFKWNAAKTKKYPSSALIASYQVTSDDKGAHLIVQLKKPVKVINYNNIEATAGKMPRAVVDIAAAP